MFRESHISRRGAEMPDASFFFRLVNPITLFQPGPGGGEQIMPTTLLLALPDFWMVRRLWRVFHNLWNNYDLYKGHIKKKAWIFLFHGKYIKYAFWCSQIYSFVISFKNSQLYQSNAVNMSWNIILVCTYIQGLC